MLTDKGLAFGKRRRVRSVSVGNSDGAGEEELLHGTGGFGRAVPSSRGIGCVSLSRCAVPSVVDRPPPAPFGQRHEEQPPGHDELARAAAGSRAEHTTGSHVSSGGGTADAGSRCKEKSGRGRPQASRLVWTRAADGGRVSVTRARHTRRGKG